MNIFQKINDVLDDARMALAFSAYEKTARARHMASGSRRFSTADLEADAAQRMAMPLRIAEQRFVAPISELEGRATRAQAHLATQTGQLAIFERDYKSELAALFASLSTLIAQCRSIQDAKSAAFSKVRAASAGLDRWHARSKRTFFGNGGRPLPSHSFFGQSLGDRDSLKSDRDDASSDIADYQRALASTYLEIKNIKASIDRVKADRQQMFDLRRQGYSVWGLKKSLFSLENQLHDFKRDIDQLESDLDEFTIAAKYCTGTISIENEIARVEALRDAFIESFDTADALRLRKAQHRNEWRLNKGR
ncbi:MAG: hypothetical protein KAX88_03700 [Rhodoferax sp.]|nr:hypothetical protein [Rhodoferax sp.]